MYKLKQTYRLLTAWIAVAILINLFFPAVMNASIMFCSSTPFANATESHTSASCWMNTNQSVQLNFNDDHCTFEQLCEQGITSVFKEIPVRQHENFPPAGILSAVITLDFTYKESTKVRQPLSFKNTLAQEEIYLLNSSLLN